MGPLHDLDEARHFVFFCWISHGMYYTMEDERPQRGRGQGHVTYFLTRKFFWRWIGLPVSTANTYCEFNVVIKRCISRYFGNGTDTRVPQNIFSC